MGNEVPPPHYDVDDDCNCGDHVAQRRLSDRAVYSRPDTSDKESDETWTQYWDRKRRERHGKDCDCLLCGNEERISKMPLPPHGGAITANYFDWHLYPPRVRHTVDCELDKGSDGCVGHE